MNKFYSLVGLALLGLSSYNAGAQITLSSADMPTVGKSFQNDFDTLTSSVSKLSPGSKGAAVTWNFGAVIMSYDQNDSMVAPSTTPYASAFTSANLADTTFGSTGYTYFNGSSSSFDIVGAEQNVMGVMVGIVFNPAMVELNFPGNYLNTNGGTTKAKIPALYYKSPPFDSVKGTITVTYADTIDAYGSITTPFSTYNVLRQKGYEYDIDSIFAHTAAGWQFIQAQKNKTYTYRWFANGIGDAVAVMTMDSTNTKVKSFEWYAPRFTGINEVSQAHHTLVYPNPASTQVTFRFSSQNAQYVSVYDMAGREITRAEMKNGTSVINTASYSNGLYLYRLTDKSGNVLDNGKFTVQQ